jgi:hypothetical protein
VVIKLSALVCAENDAPRLAECLRGLSFCDEIVVAADRPTPALQDIARRHRATLIAGIFPQDGQRRMAGADACTGDWVLEVNPGEEVEPALAWEIRATLRMRPAGDWLTLPIANYVGGRHVRHGWTAAMAPTREPRLYRREARRFESGLLSGRSAGDLTGALRRILAEDARGLLAWLGGREAASGGPVTQFFASYLARGGWREGRLGLLIALLCGIQPLLAASRPQGEARPVTTSRRAADLARVSAR